MLELYKICIFFVLGVHMVKLWMQVLNWCYNEDIEIFWRGRLSSVWCLVYMKTLRKFELRMLYLHVCRWLAKEEITSTYGIDFIVSALSVVTCDLSSFNGIDLHRWSIETNTFCNTEVLRNHLTAERICRRWVQNKALVVVLQTTPQPSIWRTWPRSFITYPDFRENLTSIALIVFPAMIPSSTYSAIMIKLFDVWLKMRQFSLRIHLKYLLCRDFWMSSYHACGDPFQLYRALFSLRQLQRFLKSTPLVVFRWILLLWAWH